jgi:hypothetical protein
MNLKKSILILILGFLTICTGTVQASTPDGQTPAEETVCDNESGAAFGLCNAYCEAMDCDSPAPQASATACSRVRANFLRFTGRPLPCDVVCPCAVGLARLSLFADIVSGMATPQSCTANSSVISVGVGSAFVLVTSAACSDHLGTSVPLTAPEALVCRDILRKAAATAGVACVAPE